MFGLYASLYTSEYFEVVLMFPGLMLMLPSTARLYLYVDISTVQRFEICNNVSELMALSVHEEFISFVLFEYDISIKLFDVTVWGLLFNLLSPLIYAVHIDSFFTTFFTALYFTLY